MFPCSHLAFKFLQYRYITNLAFPPVALITTCTISILFVSYPLNFSTGKKFVNWNNNVVIKLKMSKQFQAVFLESYIFCCKYL